MTRRLATGGLVLIGLGIGSAPASKVPECAARGTLTIYPMMGPVGTVANCEHRGESGALTKSVYYSSRSFNMTGPFLESDLVVQKITEFDYNESGQLVRERNYGSEPGCKQR